jgi:hypothetical protein
MRCPTIPALLASLAACTCSALAANAIGAAQAQGRGLAAMAKHCPDLHERGGQTAGRIVADGISCKLAREGIETYLGAPQGCITSSGCGQSGIDSYPRSGVYCRRHNHRVRCEVIAGRRRGVVTFVVHPIGYPGLPGTKP